MTPKQFRVFDSVQNEMVYFDFDDISAANFLYKMDYRYVWGEYTHKNGIKYPLKKPTVIKKENIETWNGHYNKEGDPVYEKSIYKRTNKVTDVVG